MHICLKQYYIYMLNQELDMLSGLLNRDLKSNNRNAVHWRSGGEGRREGLGIVRACQSLGTGDVSFYFWFSNYSNWKAALQYKARELKCSRRAHTVTALPLPSAIPVSCLFSGGGVAKHTSCPPTLSKRQMAACRRDGLILYLEINTWCWEPEDRRPPHPLSVIPPSAHQCQNATRAVSAWEKYSVFKVDVTLK